MVTLEDIEDELNPWKQTGFKNKMAAKAKMIAMNAVIARLDKAKALLDAEEPGLGKRVISNLILGRHKLTAEEHLIAVKKFGNSGLDQISSMEHLNTAQKQFLFKKMGWDIKEVE